MALTLEQAQQAGQLAQEITGLQSAIDAMQSALAAQAEAIEFSAAVLIGGQQMDLKGRIPMNVTDTATVFTAVMAVYQNDMTALTAQLSAIGS